jgi:hypothetical protein
VAYGWDVLSSNQGPVSHCRVTWLWLRQDEQNSSLSRMLLQHLYGYVTLLPNNRRGIGGCTAAIQLKNLLSLKTNSRQIISKNTASWCSMYCWRVKVKHRMYHTCNYRLQWPVAELAPKSSSHWLYVVWISPVFSSWLQWSHALTERRVVAWNVSFQSKTIQNTLDREHYLGKTKFLKWRTYTLHKWKVPL